jgi:hypothetical protein
MNRSVALLTLLLVSCVEAKSDAEHKEFSRVIGRVSNLETDSIMSERRQVSKFNKVFIRGGGMAEVDLIKVEDSSDVRVEFEAPVRQLARCKALANRRQNLRLTLPEGGDGEEIIARVYYQDLALVDIDGSIRVNLNDVHADGDFTIKSRGTSSIECYQLNAEAITINMIGNSLMRMGSIEAVQDIQVRASGATIFEADHFAAMDARLSFTEKSQCRLDRLKINGHEFNMTSKGMADVVINDLTASMARLGFKGRANAKITRGQVEHLGLYVDGKVKYESTGLSASSVRTITNNSDGSLIKLCAKSDLTIDGIGDARIEFSGDPSVSYQNKNVELFRRESSWIPFISRIKPYQKPEQEISDEKGLLEVIMIR